MDKKHRANQAQQAVNPLKKWVLVAVVLPPYLFVSGNIIYSLAQPVTVPCGNGAFASVVLHFLLALIVAIVLSFRFFRNKKFPLTLAIIMLAVVMILPFISYSLF